MRILAFAYACEPGSGSEPGAGWQWSRMLASFGETCVITRTNNATAIEPALANTPEAANLRFVYVDLPRWARFWKRGQRGVRVYYLLWQALALARARRLHRERPFDLVWHLTLANAWLGSLAALVGPRFVYGPVGGGLRPPMTLAPALGLRGAAYELLRAAVRGAGRYANPLARRAWRGAELILVQTPETASWLPRRHRSRTVVFPNVVLEVGSPADERDGRHPPDDGRPRTAMFAGRLLPLKGVALAIRAVALAPEWRLLVAGDGPDAARLRRLARRAGVDNRVAFVGWRPRADVERLMREEADVLLFPSLHDEAGWAVAEALACGLPVVCLDLGGPPRIAGSSGVAVPASGGPARVASALAEALSTDKDGGDVAIARAREWSLPERRKRLHELLRRRLGLHDVRDELEPAFAPAAVGGATTTFEGMDER